ncbi:MAG: hypothetical protein J5J06_01600 [Phycisphaerae bacterium]|nr:hypothetical protein [Phycisphaerae bacterium]
MKFLFGSVVVIGLALAGVYYAGGFATFDPDEQGRQVRASIAPGMSWEAVVDTAGEPKHYQPILRSVQKFPGGGEVEFFKPGPKNPFRRESVQSRVQEGSLPHGFLIAYVYSASTAFTVRFDGSGAVHSIDDAMTMNDLLQMPRD